MDIGVLNVDPTRSVRDNQLQNEFNCDRQVNYPVHLGNDIGVLGVNNNRSVKDMKMMEAFSCGMRENYGQQRLRVRSPGSNPGCLYASNVENYDIPNPYIKDSKARFVLVTNKRQ
jgi:hypothetical protein